MELLGRLLGEVKACVRCLPWPACTCSLVCCAAAAVPAAQTA